MFTAGGVLAAAPSLADGDPDRGAALNLINLFFDVYSWRCTRCCSRFG
jgi:hypothetical protein